ncbi:MAG: adenosylcobinamide-GDP ribazoletransferase [Nitrospirae bacterium YQR-1]
MIIRIIKRITAGFQFLTIIPLPQFLYCDDTVEIGKSSAWFPVTGLAIGLMSAMVWFAARSALPLEVSCFMVVAATILVTGGLHLDGLSDTFDAIAARKPQQQRLAIMKSGSAGPIGATAIVVVIILKYLLLKNAIAQTGLSPLYVLSVFPVAGRFAATSCLFLGRSAKEDGLGYIFISNTGLAEILLSGCISVLITSAANYIFNAQTDPFSITGPPVLIFTAVYLFSVVATVFLQSKFGGLTGDHAGAIIEGGELIFLFACNC